MKEKRKITKTKGHRYIFDGSGVQRQNEGNVDDGDDDDYDEDNDDDNDDEDDDDDNDDDDDVEDCKGDQETAWSCFEVFIMTIFVVHS